MKLSDRQTQIIEFLTSRGGTLSSSELTESFDVSVSQIAEHLAYHSDLRIITNNLNAALTLCSNTNIDTYVVGGRVRQTDEDIVGEEATAQFRDFQVNYGICGVAGISESGHLLNFSSEESHLFKAIVENCEKRILVADHHKFLRSAPVKSGHLRDFDLLLTDSISSELKSLCKEADLQVVTQLDEAL